MNCMMYSKREGSAKGTPRPPLLRLLPQEMREASFVPPWYPGRIMWAHAGFLMSTLQGGAQSGDATVGGRSRGAAAGKSREQANGDRRERGEGGGRGGKRGGRREPKEEEEGRKKVTVTTSTATTYKHSSPVTCTIDHAHGIHLSTTYVLPTFPHLQDCPPLHRRLLCHG